MNNTRDTKQREAIRDAFKNAGDRILSPKEVCEIASKRVKNIGIATVYRNIKTLLEKGEIIPITLPGQADRYVMHSSTNLSAILINSDGTVTHPVLPNVDAVPGYIKRTYFINN